MIKKTYIPSKPRNPKLSTATGTSGVGKTEFNQAVGSSHEHYNKGVLDRITEEMLVGALRDLITSTDTESELTDENILSALRVLDEITKNNEAFLEDLKERFLSKIEPDTAQKLITFIEGIEVGTFTTGALGSGAALKMVDGMSYAEVDNLIVRQKATFRELIIEALKHIGGQLVLSPARMKCNKVVDGGSFYKCYFDTGDGEVSNEFVEGDLARCQVFTGNGTKFYWRLVTLVGEDWINLSKTSAAEGSDAPEAGDDIVQLGNATDTTRQSAIILSTVGVDAPSWKQYSGINSFSLEGKETTVFSKLGNKIEGKTVFTSGGTNLDDHLDGVAQDILDALKAAQDAEDKAQQAIEDAEANVATINTEVGKLQEQLDGEVSNWFYAYSPTLANYPASDWNTNVIKDRHVGDTFTNTEVFPAENAGKSWRFVKNGSTYSWTAIADSDAVKALLEASKAQATADGKSTTHLFQPTKYKLGDMWVLNADQTVNGTAYKQGDILTAIQDSETFVQAHWLKRVRYTDDTAVENLQIGGRNLFSVNDFVADNKARGYSTINVINYNGNIAYRSSSIVNNHDIPHYLQGKFEANTQYYLQFKINWESYTNSGAQYIFQIRYTDGTTSNLAATTSQTYRAVLTAANKTIDYITTTRQHDGTVVIYEVQIEKANKATDWKPAIEDVQAEINKAQNEAENAKIQAERAQLQADGYMRARYVRDWAHGSDTNPNANHWREIEVVNKSGVNLALNLPSARLSTNGTPHASYPLTNAIDGDLTTTAINGYNASVGASHDYIQIDLGQVHYDIDFIKVIHTTSIERTYFGTKTEISEDGTNWIAIFDSAVEGTYYESEEGKIHTQRYASVMDRIAETEAKTRFQTLIDGGLIYTALMKLFDTISGDETAFISGKQGAGKNLPAFGAGGSYQDALAGTAKAIIRHDGSSKFTDTEITGTINAKNGTIDKLTMAPNGVIELPPTFTSRKGRIDNSGIQLVYDGSNSQSIEWYTGLGTYSGRIAPNSQGHLSISSSFGVGIQSQLINIGTEAFVGNINIGSGLAKIDFNGSSINNIKEMTNIGYTSMVSLTLMVPNDTSLILRQDTPLSILTSVGSNSFLKSIYMNNNNLLRDGTIKWILNRSASAIGIATDGNIRINSGDLNALQAYSLTPFIYSAGYWYKHSDHR